MTAIEFYDRTPIENVISSLTTVPDKIVFIGDSKVKPKFDLYSAFIGGRKLEIEIAYRNIKRNDINNIVEVLSEIIETEEQCVFDLTGGEDLVLVAMGIVYERYPDKNIQMQRFNIRNGVVTDCDNDGNVIYSGAPEITVKENIEIHGGQIRFQTDGDDRTYLWDLSDDFIADVEKMWSVCRGNPGLWNSQLNVLGELDRCNTQNSELSYSVNISNLQDHLKREGIKYVAVNGLLRLLAKKHLIFYLNDDPEVISFTYKNEQVKKCLNTAGTVLELKVLITAKALKNNDGEAFYTDSMSGVYIDWDGEFHNKNDKIKDTENEIDVILMKGLTPIFISCKNGMVEEDELYKLETVTDRFGGLYAKKVLIATYLGRKSKSMEHFKQRAKDMKINLIDGVHKLTDAQFAKMVKHLINS